jgi:hypothetical protein
MNFRALQEAFANALFPSQFVAWIDAVSGFLSGENGGPQAGIATLTNGVSAAIPANITATTRITFGMRTVNGAFGTPVVTILVAGTPGSFTFASANPATGALVATDNGTYFWHAIDS